MEFHIAIPSYKRADTLETHTLAFCLKSGINPSRIHIFVVDDKEEIASYAPLTDKYNVKVHTGPLGLHHMRNFITDFFPEGEHILQMDDDVKNLYMMEEDKSVQNVNSCKRYPLSELSGMYFMSWVECAFSTLLLSNARMFGTYPVKNGFFMKDLPYMSENLRFCVGTIWGCINDKSIRINIEEKEDFERTILFYRKYGSVHRYNHIAPKTTYFITRGGMQSRGIDRRESSNASCVYLVNAYPAYCKFHRVKKNGIHEIKLLRQT